MVFNICTTVDITDDVNQLLMVCRQLALSLEGKKATRSLQYNLLTAIIQVKNTVADIIILGVTGIACSPKLGNTKTTTTIKGTSYLSESPVTHSLVLPDSTYDALYSVTGVAGVLNNPDHVSLITSEEENTHSDISFGNMCIINATAPVYTFKAPLQKYIQEESLNVPNWARAYLSSGSTSYYTSFDNKLFSGTEPIPVSLKGDTRTLYVVGGALLENNLLVVVNAIGQSIIPSLLVLKYSNNVFTKIAETSSGKIKEPFILDENNNLVNSDYSISIEGLPDDINITFAKTPAQTAIVKSVVGYIGKILRSDTNVQVSRPLYQGLLPNSLSYRSVSSHYKSGDITYTKYPIYSIQSADCTPYVTAMYKDGYYSLVLPTCANCDNPKPEWTVNCGSIEDSGKWSNELDENGCGCYGTIIATGTLGDLSDTNSDLVIPEPDPPYYVLSPSYTDDAFETTPYSMVSFFNHYNVSYTESGCMRNYTAVGCGGSVTISIRTAGHWLLVSTSRAITADVTSNSTDCDGSSWFSMIGEPLKVGQVDCNSVVNGMTYTTGQNITTSENIKVISTCNSFSLFVSTTCGFSPSCGGLNITKQSATGGSGCPDNQYGTVQVYEWTCF